MIAFSFCPYEQKEEKEKQIIIQRRHDELQFKLLSRLYGLMTPAAAYKQAMQAEQDHWHVLKHRTNDRAELLRKKSDLVRYAQVLQRLGYQ